jgi:predicted CXXCH cytochrome family protein
VPLPAKHTKLTSWALLIVAAIVLGAALFALAAAPREVTAGAPPAVVSQQASLQIGPGSENCLLCHEGSEAVVVFPDGSTLPVDVDPAVLASSGHGIHAGEPLACTSCHAPARYQYPHPPPEGESVREYELIQAQRCERCHVNPHITSHPGLESESPVVCTDCHGAHDVATVEEWHAGTPVGNCVECHQASNVEVDRPQELTHVINRGLFGDEPDNDYCLSCHTLPNRTLLLDSGETLPLTIDEERFHDSVHGTENSWQPLECVNCHEGYLYPHEPVVARSLREYRLENYPMCAQCHEDKYEATLDDVHGEALASGNEEAAVCTDCHGAHYVEEPDEPRSRISIICGQCHEAIFEEYAASVHGEALLEESNPDVATCVDCHGVHSIPDPNLAAFRNSSPQLCGACHADAELMAKYDISIHVFDTYVDDFHGTTATIASAQDPDALISTAVCYDCHGVHDIKDPEDPDNGIKANLLATCRQCHPDASTNFPDAWTSHYPPSLEHYPLVFLVNWFYRIIIPATVGGLGFFVLTDAYRRLRHRRQEPEGDHSDD